MKKSKTKDAVNFDARLIIAAPSQDTNISWATGFSAPDPTVFMEVKGRRYLILRDLEVDRARKQARIAKAYAASDLEKLVRKNRKSSHSNNGSVSWTDMVDHLFRQWRVKTICVPQNFGVAYADHLRKMRYKIVTKGAPFFEERTRKTAKEVLHVRRVMKTTERALHKAIDTIAKSTIRRGKLVYRGSPLTSEIIRDLIHQELLAGHCIADLNTIVACGVHCIDPHDIGHGFLRPHQSIIIDVFPRSLETGYYGDITRTVVKGKASPRLKKMYQAVYEAVKVAQSLYKPHMQTPEIHRAVTKVFSDRGFVTGVLRGRRQGFIHGVGHGVGLDIHEEPSIGAVQRVLLPGHLVTLEPGLYYQGIGGVRIEDLYYITKTGAQRITRFPHVFEV